MKTMTTRELTEAFVRMQEEQVKQGQEIREISAQLHEVLDHLKKSPQTVNSPKGKEDYSIPSEKRTEEFHTYDGRVIYGSPAQVKAWSNRSESYGRLKPLIEASDKKDIKVCRELERRLGFKSGTLTKSAISHKEALALGAKISQEGLRELKKEIRAMF